MLPVREVEHHFESRPGVQHGPVDVVELRLGEILVYDGFDVLAYAQHDVGRHLISVAARQPLAPVPRHKLPHVGVSTHIVIACMIGMLVLQLAHLEEPVDAIRLLEDIVQMLYQSRLVAERIDSNVDVVGVVVVVAVCRGIVGRVIGRRVVVAVDVRRAIAGRVTGRRVVDRVTHRDRCDCSRFATLAAVKMVVLLIFVTECFATLATRKLVGVDL